MRYSLLNYCRRLFYHAVSSVHNCVGKSSNLKLTIMGMHRSLAKQDVLNKVII
jgi:hypothetical protein